MLRAPRHELIFHLRPRARRMAKPRKRIAPFRPPASTKIFVLYKQAECSKRPRANACILFALIIVNLFARRWLPVRKSFWRPGIWRPNGLSVRQKSRWPTCQPATSMRTLAKLFRRHRAHLKPSTTDRTHTLKKSQKRKKRTTVRRAGRQRDRGMSGADRKNRIRPRWGAGRGRADSHSVSPCLPTSFFAACLSLPNTICHRRGRPPHEGQPSRSRSCGRSPCLR